MKDYDHVVVWLDYFDKELSRSQGRRLSRDFCVNEPSLESLSAAVKMAGYTIKEANDSARHPRRAHVRSGYLVLPKASSPKTRVLYRIAPKLVRVVKKNKQH